MMIKVRCADCKQFSGGVIDYHCNYVVKITHDPIWANVELKEAPTFARTPKGHCGPKGKHFVQKRKWWKLWIA